MPDKIEVVQVSYELIQIRHWFRCQAVQDPERIHDAFQTIFTELALQNAAASAEAFAGLENTEAKIDRRIGQRSGAGV